LHVELERTQIVQTSGKADHHRFRSY